MSRSPWSTGHVQLGRAVDWWRRRGTLTGQGLGRAIGVIDVARLTSQLTLLFQRRRVDDDFIPAQPTPARRCRLPPCPLATIILLRQDLHLHSAARIQPDHRRNGRQRRRPHRCPARVPQGRRPVHQQVPEARQEGVYQDLAGHRHRVPDHGHRWLRRQADPYPHQQHPGRCRLSESIREARAREEMRRRAV